jgi:hypothetical protein
MCVLHRCDVPQCVKPSHLFLGTPKDNSEDMIKKKRTGKLGPHLNDIKALAKRGLSYQEIGQRFGVRGLAIYRAVIGWTWNSAR